MNTKCSSSVTVTYSTCNTQCLSSITVTHSICNTKCLSSVTITYSTCNTKCSSSITIILPSHKMQRKAHRFTINIQSESVRQIFHICLALHTSCAELFYPISPRKATFRMKDMATPFVQQPSPYCQSEALFHSCQE